MNPFEKVRSLPEIGEIEEILFKRATEAALKVPFAVNKVITAKNREKARIRTLANNLTGYLRRALRLIELLDSGEVFYKEFARLFFPDEEIKRAKKRLLNSIRILKKLENDYLRKVDRNRELEKFSQIRKEA
ncbi:hypothetical protein DRN86_01480, partial [Candidatus Geothermarchaeota archaeon]